MIGYILIGAAAAIDGFAAGVIIGRKWAAKLTNAAIQADGAKVAAVVTKVEAAVTPVVTTAEDDAKALEDRVKAALVEAQKAPTP